MWRRGSAWTALGRAVAFPGRRGWSLSQRYSSTGVTSQITGKRLASVAVGCLAFVSAGAVYDLMSQWVSKRIEEEWAEDWDEELADEEGAPKEMAAAFALARSLRYQRNNVGTRHLLFVRHAQPGEAEPLSPLGLQQAELAAQRIFSQVGLSKYKVIFHAPSAEAKATADVIQKRLGKVLAKESDLLVEGVPMVPDPAPEQLQQLPKDVLFKDMVRAEGALRTHLAADLSGLATETICSSFLLSVFAAERCGARSFFRVPRRAGLSIQTAHGQSDAIVFAAATRLASCRVEPRPSGALRAAPRAPRRSSWATGTRCATCCAEPCS
ncbi:unnamed protein product [Effrenium voratum]|nr:unnamed protein product [Effrenium voratum]